MNYFRSFVILLSICKGLAMFYSFKARDEARKNRMSIKKQYRKKNIEVPQTNVSIIEIWLDKQPKKENIILDCKNVQDKMRNSIFKTFFESKKEANQGRYQQKRCKTYMSEGSVSTQTKTEDILFRKQLQSFNQRKSCQIQKSLRVERENSNRMSFTDFRHCFKKQLPYKNTDSNKSIDEKWLLASFCRPVTYSFKTQILPSNRVQSKSQKRSISIIQGHQKKLKNNLWDVSAWSTQIQLEKDSQFSLN